MRNLENKQKNLNQLLNKLSGLSFSYTQSNNNSKKIEIEKNQLEREKKNIEKK